MKKLLVILTILCFVLSYSMAFAQRRSPPESRNIIPASSCAWLTFYGVLCHDTDDGKIYKWDGAGQVELAAGGAGDMTIAQFDTDVDGFIDANNGGTDIDSSALTGTPYVTAGVWSVENAATMRTNIGAQLADTDLDYLATFTPTADVKTILNAANDAAIMTALGLSANAQSFVTAANNAAMMTALGLTANAQTLIGETFAQMQASLSIDDLITLSGVAEGSVHLATFTGATIPDNQTNKQALQALETALELRATIASPTFTGVATFPNDGLHVLDTDASHDLIITPGSNLSADRILTITTGDAARTLSIEADSIINQDVSSDANPSFSTLNLVGANALNVGNSRTVDGTIRFKSGTALNDFYHEIRGSNFGANTLWILPTAVPGGSNYLLNVDADGTMGYAAPTFTSFTGGNWKVFYTNGTGVITELALGDANKYLMSNGAAAAPTFETPGGAGDVISVGDCGTGACNDESSDGGTYLGLYSASGAVRLRNNAGVMEARTAADAGYANFKAGGFDSELAAGNVGYIRIKEDPANGTNYRAFSVVSALAEDLTFTWPTGTPTANDLFILGTPAAGISAMTYSSLKTLMDTALGSTRGSILYRGAAGWTILTPGTAGYALLSAGAGADPAYGEVTAAAAGADHNVQYATTGALASEAAFAYEPDTNTLTVDAITGVAAGNIAKTALVAKGDLVTASAASTPAVITDVAAGQPLLSGGVAQYPGYAGYTFAATAAQTYTFPTTTSSLARTDAGQTFTGVNIFTAPTFTTSITPTVAEGSTIGTAALEWGSVYLKDGAIIYGQIDQSATLTSSASTWTASNFVSSGTTKTTGALSPATAGGTTTGTNALPYSSVYIGAAATNNIQLTGTAASAKVITLPGQTGNVTVSPTVATAGHAYLSSATEGIASWSTPTYPSASGGAGKILRSDATDNVYSTSTFADTYAKGTFLYNAAANTVASLAHPGAANYMLVTNAVDTAAWAASTGTGAPVQADSPIFVDDITVAAAGVKLTGANGALTILGLGDGTDEDVKIDLNTTANTIIISSPASSATTISFSALNLVTTGTIQGGILINSDANGMSAAEMAAVGVYGTLFIATGAGTWILPTAVVGMSVCVMGAGVHADLIVDVTANDYIILKGTTLVQNAGITQAAGATAGDFVCLVATAAGYWSTMGMGGTWVTQ